MNLIETVIQILKQISFEGIPKKQSWNMEIDIFPLLPYPKVILKKAGNKCVVSRFLFWC